MVNNYKIKNQSDDTAELIIYGIVGDPWDELEASDIIKDLAKVTAKNIKVRINSSGGSVFAGISIYNALKQHKANVTIRIDSLAASIASIIAMSGTVEMPENAFMMIHNPWGMVGGDAEDMVQMATVLEKIKASLLIIYNAKTGIDKEDLSRMMDDETWMIAKEAVDMGFADIVLDEKTTYNNIEHKFFNRSKNMPEQLKSVFGAIKNEKGAQKMAEKKQEKAITLDSLKSEYPDLVKALIAEGAKAEQERMRAVSSALIPGHEKLINKLMLDGKTTGAEAAMQIIHAENALRATKKKEIETDAVDPVQNATPPETENVIDESAPVEDRAKATWEKDNALKAEFVNDYDSFLAYFKATDAGLVKIVKGGK